MKWILIVAIHWGYGTAATTAEFDDRAACQFAMNEFSKTWDAPKSMVVGCYPKSTEAQH